MASAWLDKLPSPSRLQFPLLDFHGKYKHPNSMIGLRCHCCTELAQKNITMRLERLNVPPILLVMMMSHDLIVVLLAISCPIVFHNGAQINVRHCLPMSMSVCVCVCV